MWLQDVREARKAKENNSDNKINDDVMNGS
jgi:hypothetical protein